MRIVCIFKKAPLSHTAGQKASNKQLADNTVVLRWLLEGEEVDGGGIKGPGGGGGGRGAPCPSKASSHPLHLPPSLPPPAPKKQKATQLELEYLCVSVRGA